MKNIRQQKILELVEKYSIGTQEELIEKLKEAGFTVTQTTVSRDINQLKLVKAITANNEYRYITPDVRGGKNVSAINSAIAHSVINVEAAQNIIVVKTMPGMANAVAVCIDSLNRAEVVGSVAGDDTILFVVRSYEIAKAVEENLKGIFLV